MKNLKNLLSTLALVSCSLFATFQTQAAIIEQDIFIEDDFFGLINLGTVAVEIDNDVVNTGQGLLYTSFDFPAISLVSLEILGSTGIFDFFDFDAGVDSDNIFAGIEFLFFDIEEFVFVDNWSYQLLFDAANTDMNYADIFDSQGSLVAFGENVFLGQARLSDVSLPSSLSLAGLMALVLFSRRRAQK
ncbi:hypothetical protein [Alteromonas ponticola]|uniref:PEP-CTERM sorting domain-containing protein n=1 Tax=Alteromonas ponticola TaxID=2720613 RepID=A0ABX1QZD8_9ALTE|nr:hypothetical protein [Alteromonas ponticola]NMH58726.1 hypothetical protein [Alteromonas ponticola]